MDEEGYLYFTTNKLPFILNDKLDWEQDESHFRVIRVFVNDKGYLAPWPSLSRSHIVFATYKIASAWIRSKVLKNHLFSSWNVRL